MTTSLVPGVRDWRLRRDQEGFREYSLKLRVESTTLRDGPERVSNTAGLPIVGQPWIVDNDRDLWVWCTAQTSVTPVKTDGPEKHWDLEYLFSNKPGKRCQDYKIEDPLLEPQKVSGSFNFYREEATHDRFGNQLLTSSWELMRGQQVEFDNARAIIRIEQNVPNLQIELLTAMNNTLNDSPLWGLPRRCIRLMVRDWREHFLGSCEVYYTRVLEFEAYALINPLTGILYSGFDKVVPDMGNKVLNGHWDIGDDCTVTRWVLDDICGHTPNPGNPSDFNRYQDRYGNTTQCLLDGAGKPYNPTSLAVTTDCSSCPNGMPQSLLLQGMEWNVEIALTYQSGCTWTGTGSDGTAYSLVFAVVDPFGNPVPTGTWTLSVTGATPARQWQVNTAERPWNCYGLNRLHVVYALGSTQILGQVQPTAANAALPQDVFIKPADVSLPGVRYIEKYNETNFLLLGIPLVLGIPSFYRG